MQRNLKKTKSLVETYVLELYQICLEINVELHPVSDLALDGSHWIEIATWPGLGCRRLQQSFSHALSSKPYFHMTMWSVLDL
jgi:hypothetical protein